MHQQFLEFSFLRLGVATAGVIVGNGVIVTDALKEDFNLLMTPQNQGFSSNKTLPEMTRPKSDPVISRFQDFVFLCAKMVEL